MAVRRVSRITPAPRIPVLFQTAIGAARGVLASNGAATAPNMAGRPTGFQNRQPSSNPVQAYTEQLGTPLTGGYAAGTVKAGAAQAQAGPQGLGTVWYPASAFIATTTGASDGASCLLYLTPQLATGVGPQTQLVGSAFAGTGGGVTIGLSVPPMYPGYFLIAVWSGCSTNGDLATLTIYGTMQSLQAGR